MVSEESMDAVDLELERALLDLGEHLKYPPVPDLSLAVRAHLERQPARQRRRVPFLRRKVLYPALAAVAILAAVLAIFPGARSAVASWFQIAGVRIESGGSLPGPLGHNLNLGERVSLDEAQRRAPFPILVPTLPGLHYPDEIYAGTPPFNGRVSLLYAARPGLPRASTTGAGLLITEFQSTFFAGKMIPPGTTVKPIEIGGEQGVWIAGHVHVVYYLDQQHTPLRDTIRLAGNVLLWQHGSVTVRLEGRLSQQRATALAQTMRARNGKRK